MLLWWLADEPALGRSARRAIASEENEVAVSAASAWEIAIKRALGRLDAPEEIEEQLSLERFQLLAITHAHAWAAGALPPHHADPFDRMLVAQARLEGLTIVTRDPDIERYPVATLAA